MDNLLGTIDTLTAEMLIYNQQAGRCILEIGRRLKQVKESLPHGEWLPYLKERVDFAPNTVHRFMQCAEEFLNTPLTEHLPTGHIRKDLRYQSAGNHSSYQQVTLRLAELNGQTILEFEISNPILVLGDGPPTRWPPALHSINPPIYKQSKHRKE